MENTLRFKNGKFKIMSVGDLHEKISWDTKNDKARLHDMHNLIEMGIKAFSPDLIVLLGDTCCVRDESEDFSAYKNAIRTILKPILDSKIPFAYVLGNHEHDTQTEEQIVKAYSEIDTCLAFNDSESKSYLDYNLPVKASSGDEDILNLWFMDSNNLAASTVDDGGYDWVHEDQIKWYEKKARELADANNGKTVPAILFQHIPVCEEYELLREAKPYEIPVAAQGHRTNSSKYYVLKDGVKGYLGEGPATPDLNHGQFESWKRTGDVKAAFFGHDHLNDFTGYVDGIMLGQNKTSGFCAYTDGCRSAIRITEVNENEPDVIKSEIYHFKELGLECHCLGPIEKRITDRQSINLHKASTVLSAVSTVLTAATLIKIHKNKNKER